MNVLFYSTYHFNSETFGPHLELMQEHINKGDNVMLLTCNGELQSCQTNPFHKKMVCETCISMRKNGIACLTEPVHQFTLEDILPKYSAPFDFLDLNSIPSLKESVYESFDIGMAVLSSVVSILRDPTPDLQKNKKLIEQQSISALWVYEAVKKIIDDNDVQLIYVFNARFATLRACLRASHYKQKDCFVIEESNDREHYAVYENAMPHSISYVEKLIHEFWDNGETAKVELAENYYKVRSRGLDSRFGHFTANQNLDKLPDNWDPKKQNIAIYISSEDEFVSIGKEWENNIYSTQVSAIEKIGESMLKYSEFVFYIRVHPNLKGIINDSILKLYGIDHKNIKIIPADSLVSTYGLMFNASKVISFGSSVGIEAAAFGKVSILAGKTFYMNLGSTYNPQSHEELIELLLSQDLPAKPREGALKYAYYLINSGIKYKFFKRKDTFQGYLNGKIFGPRFSLLAVRRIGRLLRIRNEKKRKVKNLKILQTLQK